MSRIRKKTFAVLAMRIRTPKLNLQSNNLQVNRFDLNDVEAFLNYIKTLRTRSQDLGDRFIFLEQFDDDYHNNYYSGWFISARYGEIPDWIDARTMVRRANNKRITEGEENRTYFVLEKATGLLLLQSDNKRIATGAAVDNYLRSKIDGFESYINSYNRRNVRRLMINKGTFIQLDYSIDTTFMEEVRRLARIKKTTIQCAVANARQNNVVTAISNQLNGVDKYDEVEFSIVNKERRMGVRGIETFLENLQDRELYRNVIVQGTTTMGRPKTISWENHAKKYEVKVQINTNGLVYQDDMINQLIELATQNQ